MNKTKKLTQGAMLLAIVGALMLLDRQLSYFFSTIILLLIPVVIAVYSTMYSIKEGGMLCVGLVVLTILFGYLTTYIYMPISIIVGLAVSYGIKKGFDRRKLNIISMFIYIVAELLVAFVISPIFGISVASQLESITTTFNQMMELYGATSISSMFSNMSSLILICFVASTVLMGLLEGYLTGLLTTFVLKRMKIKDIAIKSPLDIKIPVYLSYVLLAFSALSTILMKIPNFEANYSTITYIAMCLSAVSSLVLAYYGYLFIIIYANVRLGRNRIMLVFLAIILLFPLSYLILIVVGFLYGAGPLRTYLEKILVKK